MSLALNNWALIFKIFDLQIALLPTKFFESTGLLVEKKKCQIDFQYGGHLWFLIGTIFDTFDLQVTLILPTKFWFHWPFGSREVQNRLSSSHLGLLIGMILPIFYVYHTPTLPPKFQFKLPSFDLAKAISMVKNNCLDLWPAAMKSLNLPGQFFFHPG